MQDVNRLSHDLSVENKAAAAQKISAYYDGTDISERGRKLAEDIFRIMVEDVQVKVREVLSESLKNCKSIPRDITVKLINDQDSVAVPFHQILRQPHQRRPDQHYRSAEQQQTESGRPAQKSAGRRLAVYC